MFRESFLPPPSPLGNAKEYVTVHLQTSCWFQSRCLLTCLPFSHVLRSKRLPALPVLSGRDVNVEVQIQRKHEV